MRCISTVKKTHDSWPLALPRLALVPKENAGGTTNISSKLCFPNPCPYLSFIEARIHNSEGRDRGTRHSEMSMTSFTTEAFTLLALGLFIIGARTYSRFTQVGIRGFEVDDWVMLFAAVGGPSRHHLERVLFGAWKTNSLLAWSRSSTLPRQL